VAFVSLSKPEWQTNNLFQQTQHREQTRAPFARPIPEPPSVTKATFPSNSFMCHLLVSNLSDRVVENFIVRLYRFARNLFRLPQKCNLEGTMPGKDLQLLIRFLASWSSDKL
jgi:hypothetical protein